MIRTCEICGKQFDTTNKYERFCPSTHKDDKEWKPVKPDHIRCQARSGATGYRCRNGMKPGTHPEDEYFCGSHIKFYRKQKKRQQPIVVTRTTIINEPSALPAPEYGMAILPDGSSLTYRQYIASEHWELFKVRWKEWAEQNGTPTNTCDCCGAQNCPLDHHHTTYDRTGHESYEDIVLLCRTCHTDVSAVAKWKGFDEENSIVLNRLRVEAFREGKKMGRNDAARTEYDKGVQAGFEGGLMEARKQAKEELAQQLGQRILGLLLSEVA